MQFFDYNKLCWYKVYSNNQKKRNLEMRNLYKLDNINLNYYLNGNDIKVLKNINFQIKK